MTKKMKATVVVTATDGTVWSGEIELSQDGVAKQGSAQERAVASVQTSARPTASDLKLPTRAFLSKFAS